MRGALTVGSCWIVSTESVHSACDLNHVVRLRNNEQWCATGNNHVAHHYLYERLHSSRSVAIVVRLIRTLDLHADILCLFIGEFVKFHSDLSEVESGNFLIEVLRKHIDLVLV